MFYMSYANYMLSDFLLQIIYRNDYKFSLKILYLRRKRQFEDLAFLSKFTWYLSLYFIKKMAFIKFGILFIAFYGAVGILTSEANPTVIPILKCQHGDYELVGKTCIREEVVQPTTKCPKNGKSHEGKCVINEHVEGQMKCPKGYELSGKKCISNLFVSAVYECPLHYVPATVHKGHTGAFECVKETRFKIHSACPEGFKASHDGVCYKQTYDKASIVCPKGYTPDKKGCFVAKAVNPLFVCPEHYTLQPNGSCIKEKHDDKKCPHGYNQVSVAGKEHCEKTVFRHASPVCPHGEMDKINVCWISEKEKPRYVCKHKGSTYINGKCVRVIEEEASVECTHGFKFDGEHCVKKSISAPEYKCNNSETLAKHGKCEIIVKTDLVACQGLECMKDKVKQPGIKCPVGAKMRDHGCEIITRVDPDKICDKKGELRHNKCVYYEQKEATVSCKQGELTIDGSCVLRDIVNASVKCDKGYKMSEDSDKCSKSDYIHPDMVCPPNAIIKVGKCFVEVVEKAIIGCPHGYKYETKGCVKTYEKDAILTCPKDLKLLNMTCVPKHQEKEKKVKECNKDCANPHQKFVTANKHPIETMNMDSETVNIHPGSRPMRAHEDSKLMHEHHDTLY